MKKALLGGALAIFISAPAYAHMAMIDGHLGHHMAMGHDADGDRIGDAVDHCPGTSPLATVNFMGCDTDGDMDGIADHRDDCRYTPPGIKVDTRGCRIDADIDGVVDAMDKCPTETPWGDRVNSDGCSSPAKAVLFFKTNSSSVAKEDIKKLEEVAKELKANRGTRIEIQGHADSRATSSYNASLGDRRAAAAKKILVGKFKVDPKQIVVTSHGEQRPRHYNQYAAGQGKNRRVEIHLVRELHANEGPTAREFDSIR
ncbi:MAG: OmpA family protein [Magnetococcales bacterium]|nr:OmpA family protein [Magnetococcales bacterium]